MESNPWYSIRFFSKFHRMNQSSRTITCLPRGICSWDYILQSPDGDGLIEMNTWSDKGHITWNGETFDILKPNSCRNQWIMERDGIPFSHARKTSAFSRSYQIECDGNAFTFTAESWMSGAMNLTGNDVSAAFRAQHAFTRRSIISGNWNDPIPVLFAFWLFAVLIRQTTAAGSAGAAAAAS